MQHSTTVPVSPIRSALYLVTGKTVFNKQQIGRGFLFIKNMSKLFIKIPVLIIAYLHYSIFNTESISIIIIQRMIFYFHYPVFQVLSIKQFYPSILCV